MATSSSCQNIVRTPPHFGSPNRVEGCPRGQVLSTNAASTDNSMSSTFGTYQGLEPSNVRKVRTYWHKCEAIRSTKKRLHHPNLGFPVRAEVRSLDGSSTMLSDTSCLGCFGVRHIPLTCRIVVGFPATRNHHEIASSIQSAQPTVVHCSCVHLFDDRWSALRGIPSSTRNCQQT